MRRPRALLLDAGNTIVFFDVHAAAALVAELGSSVRPEALRAAESAAKRRYEAHLQTGASHEDAWFVYMGALLEEAGIAPPLARGLVVPIRRAHDAFNLWRSVPPGLPGALDRARAGGIRLGVVSNSEGRIAELLDRVGIGDRFEVVVDSALVGVRKPDPEIFHIALRRLGVAPAESMYAGDVPAVDVEGARAAGMDAVLVDPFGCYPAIEGVPRVESVVELIDALLGANRVP